MDKKIQKTETSIVQTGESHIPLKWAALIFILATTAVFLNSNDRLKQYPIIQQLKHKSLDFLSDMGVWTYHNSSHPEHLQHFDDEKFMRNYMCDPDHGYRIQVITRDPQLFVISGFLQEGEAEHMQLIAQSRLKRSMVTSDDKLDSVDPSRTSDSAYLDEEEDKVVKCVENRAAEIVRVPVGNVESLQVVRYRKGQQYKHHYDYFALEEEKMSQWGDRLATLFVYLTDVPDDQGGHTDFPKAGVMVPSIKGNAAFWYDMDVDGNPDRKTLHAGTPVLGDIEKYGLNIWVRERCYRCTEEEMALLNAGQQSEGDSETITINEA